MHIDTRPESVAHPIAIIGAACRFPGAADLESFADLLARGTDAVTQIPPERFTLDSFYHPDKRQAGKTYTLAAGVIEEVDRFDAAFFGISPREAVQMDPQQRLLLELTHEAFEDAGLQARHMADTRTGVYVGGSSSDYLTMRLGDPSVADAYFMTGATLSTLSNRVSYIFDLKGPSFTVDTACSSSLVALHLACAAIHAGEAEMAVVAGVNLLLAPQSYVGFSRASMLSPRGRCHAFALGADGYVRAEGGGVLLLKPLAAALADGDPIRAIVEGTGINSDGRTAGLSLPSRAAQAELLRTVYAGSRIDPEELVYLEAHGTGTAVGDPIEAGALGEVLGQNRTRKLPIGSVKTNIGHLEAGSGMAGLIKAMLVLRDGMIPASLHCSVPNPEIDFDRLNLVLAREAMPIDPAGARRAAAVNSFGFGGTNAHAILSAGPGLLPDTEAAPDELPPLLVSARSRPALDSLAAAWRTRLGGMTETEAAPLLRAAARAREQHSHRLAATGATLPQILAALDSHAAGQDVPDLAVETALPRGDVAFVFAGNGSQWVGMGLEGLQDPVFSEALEEVEAELTPLLGWSVIDTLRSVDEATIRNTDVAQPLLFAVQHATTRALVARGITPRAHLGHSVGEVAAALAAGALTLSDAAHVIAARSAAQQRTVHQGGMAVLALGAADAQAMLDGIPGLELAAINSRSSVTVAGPRPALQALERLALRRRVHFALLDLDYAFHSALMEPIREGLLTALDGIAPGRAATPFYSTVFGRACDGSGLGPEYWWQNVRAPVRFADAVTAAVADGARILLEIGPSPVLQSYLRDGLRQADAPGRALPTLTRRVQAGSPMRRIAGQVHVTGHDISGASAFAGPITLDGLPRYKWQKERYWYDPTDEATGTILAQADHPLLGFRRGPAAGTWFNTLDTVRHPSLADHAVDGTALLPATAIIEMALAAGRACHPDAAAIDVLDLEITRPLLLERTASRETRFVVVGERGVFEFASRPRLSGESWTVHATGRVGAGSTAPMPALDLGVETASTLAAGELYALTNRVGLNYGPAFQTVAEVAVLGERSAVVHLVHAAGPGLGWLIDPARADGALQGLVALLAGRTGGTESLLPWRFGRVRLAQPGGVAIASAQLRILRVGPRSASAEVALRDAEGAVVASFGDCWFTKVAGGAREDLADSTYRTVDVPRAQAGTTPGPALPALPVAAEADDEAALLTEAYAGVAAHAAIAGLNPGGGPIRLGDLLAEGRLHRDAGPLVEAMLTWIERDGLGACEAGAWTLTGADDLPPAAEIWRSILAGAPLAVAEAALVGSVGQALPEMLAAGAAAMPHGLDALTRHMEVASPTGRAGIDALAETVGTVARAWPANRTMRVLEVAPFDEQATACLAEALRQSGAAVHYVAAVGPEAATQNLAAALAPLPGATVVEWDLSQDAPSSLAGGFDLVLGTLAMARTRLPDPIETLSRIKGQMADGGLLMLLEPRPNRAWDLRFGLAPGWWQGDGASCLMDGEDWLRVLAAAGLDDAQVTTVGGAVWSASLMVSRARAIAPPRAAAEPATGVVILARPDDALAVELAGAVLAGGRAATTIPLDQAAKRFRRKPPADGDILFLLPECAPAALLDTIAAAGSTLGALAVALAETAGLRLWVLARCDEGDDTGAAALRGITRVLANEAANLTPRFVRLPAGPVDLAAALAAAEIAAPGPETEILLSGGRRDVPRLRAGFKPGPLPAPGLPARLMVGRPGLMDTIAWQPMEARAPGPNEVAIAVAASGLNFRDVMWALGMLPDEALMDGLAGATLGLECAGTVTSVGRGVKGVRVNDRVMAIAPACLATHVIAPAQAVVRLPKAIGFAEGATVPVAFLTVCYALGTLANIQPGERVLIHGGAGAVGLAALQYARHRGAVVFASAGSPAKRAVLDLLGVDHVLDSRSLSFADDIRALTGGEGIDVVLNSLAGEAMERSVGVLRPFGRFLELGKRDLYGNTPLGLRALRHNVSYFAIDADQLPTQRPDVARRVFDEIAVLMEKGTLRPLPHRLFRFGEAISAFRLMQSAGHIGKLVLTPDPAGVPVTQAPPCWAPSAEGTYVVTGGLSGFGLESARWLAEQGARSLALLGRRGIETPGAAEAVAGLVAQGVMARAFACDVSDEAELTTVLGQIRATMLPIRGVLHAAMVLDDALLPQLTPERFATVLRPKLGGALALDRLTRQDKLDTFLLFSSITTAMGNPGQASYVAANAGLEALAARRRAAGLPALSVGWGPIADVGYLSREKAVSEALEQRMGRAHLNARQALGLLPALLASGHSHVDVARMQWGALRAHLPHLVSPMFDELAAETVSEAGHLDLAQLLADCTQEEARVQIGDILAEEVGAITRVPAPQIDRTRSLTDLGMDSLMAVELRMALERRFGANLPMLSLADGASIGSMAARIVRHLAGENGVDAVSASEALLAKYEGVSDDADLSLEGAERDD